MKLTPKLMKAGAVCLILAAGISGYFFTHRNEVETDDASIDGRTVDISPKVAGYIKEIYVKDNQVVKAGDIIMQIDTKDYELQAKNAQAALAAAQAALAAAQNNALAANITAPAGVAAAQEKVNSAQAAWEKAAADEKRMNMLIVSGACSQEQYDQAVASEKSTRAALDEMKADLNSANSAPEVIAGAQSTVEQLAAQAEKAKAELEQAETNLQYTKITAPADGRITKKSVNPGAYVQSGTQLCSLVSFEMWVTANFKENQLKGMRTGDKVDISVDAFPNLRLTGVVDSFQAGTGAYFSLFPAENATGNFVKTVQRIPVKIVLNNLSQDQAALLGPGMSVIPVVHIGGE
ncbi:HlyD family secretion protein [Pectinatus haikarae]|uniref:Membrane fusion protein (Multidrug efflux system) n=1 Tax=Pectinatus haikarae TaxID=349096 RepID=A0ABT9YB84_9FIRM|nr:HlyD family secretion protein [Pectinatus haikarae]MDQ0204750.1 membrane fusion protein (multidrug efflux system) [Pectinatus haikarae]